MALLTAKTKEMADRVLSHMTEPAWDRLLRSPTIPMPPPVSIMPWYAWGKVEQTPHKSIIERVIDAEVFYTMFLGKPTKIYLGRDEWLEIRKNDLKDSLLPPDLVSYYGAGKAVKPVGQLMGLSVYRRPEAHWLEIM
jgi:hypothetical protein